MHSDFREIRRQQWFQIIQACEERPRGMSIVQWTREHQISIKSYEYWKCKFRMEALEQKTEDKSVSSLTVSEDTHALSENHVTFAEIPVSAFKAQKAGSVSCTFTPDAVVNVSGTTVGFSNSASPELINRILKAVAYVS
ncbi:MAG: hypothetical protein Q4B26_10790 [Eubacteriales bacterium]|nr:hypothetical protein [Eubacteriales bacterium]